MSSRSPARGLEELGTRARRPFRALSRATRFALFGRRLGCRLLRSLRGSSPRCRPRWTAGCRFGEEDARAVMVAHPTMVPPPEMRAVEPEDGVAVEVGERLAAKRVDGAPVLTVGDRPAADVVERHFDRSHGVPGSVSRRRTARPQRDRLNQLMAHALS